MHGRKTGDRFPVPLDDHLFAVLNEIEKVREVGFGFVYAEFHGLGLSLVQFLGPWRNSGRGRAGARSSRRVLDMR